jgi:hypothetical protein
MKKFIITEEEKNRILGMHEDHGYNSLNEQTVNWQDELIKVTQGGKKTTFSNAPAVQVSDPNSEIYYTQNRWYQFPKGDMQGTITNKGSWKMENGKVSAIKDTESNTPAKTPKPALKPSGQSTPNTTGSSIGVIYKYEYPNDKKYRYGVKDGKWFGKNLANGKEFDLSTITTTITNLNNQFKDALTQQETPVDTTTTTTTAAPATVAPATPVAQ